MDTNTIEHRGGRTPAADGTTRTRPRRVKPPDRTFDHIEPTE